MKRLTPSMFQVPSSLAVALVRPAPTSEPASGSVSTIVVPHSRSTMSWAIALVALVAVAVDDAGERRAAAYIQIGALAPSTISAIAQISVEGAGVPPSSSLICRRQYSASIQAW